MARSPFFRRFRSLEALLASIDQDAFEPDPTWRFAQEREAMVVEQIERRGIRDARVLAAMRRIERHLFVPLERRRQAHEDRALSIGRNQTISQPYMVAAMSELLHLRGNERVLEVGTGCGYQAAVLAELARQVWTIEILPELHERARARLANLGYSSVRCVLGDGHRGLPERAPFDAILVAAAPDEVPGALVDQLADGGRLVIPVGTEAHQQLLRIERHGAEQRTETLFPVAFVPMTGGEG